jgi:hypothetical protein
MLVARRWMLRVAVFCVVVVPWGPRAEDAVSLRFAWPDDLVLRVERSFEREEIREPGPAPPGVRSSTRFVWTGKRSAELYRVAFSDFGVVKGEAPPTSSDSIVQLEYAARAVEPLLPTLVLDSTGQMVDLEGLAELGKKVRARYESIPGLSSDAQAMGLVGMLTSGEMLSQRAHEEWGLMIHGWHGVDALVRSVHETPGVTGGGIQSVFTHEIERRIPCQGEGGATSCIRLVVANVPRFEDARSAAKALLGFDFVGLGAPPTASLMLEHRYTTDADPDTLVPSRYVKEKQWSVRWVDADGKPRAVGRVDRWAYAFSPAH